MAVVCAVFAGVVALGLVGCALEAAPQPPSLEIARPVRDLTAARAGDAVTLRWTMPRSTTDKAKLKGDQIVIVCRALLPIDSDAPCAEIARMQVDPGVATHWIDRLPAPFLSGTPRLVRYNVELESPWQESAGLSNNATIVAGMPPAPVQGLNLTVQKDGVVLHWQPSSPMPHLVMRIERRLVAKVSDPHRNQNQGEAIWGEAPAQVQLLEVPLNLRDQGQAIDRDAALGQTYTYTLQRVLHLKVDGQEVTLPGAASQSVTINARNVFVPATPQDLEAVADAQARAIDLSWAPSADQDVIGYRVYRRVARSAGGKADSKWSAVSPAHPLLTAPAWQDTTVTPGVSYEYAVEAVGANGLASPRSAPVTESVEATAAE